MRPMLPTCQAAWNTSPTWQLGPIFQPKKRHLQLRRTGIMPAQQFGHKFNQQARQSKLSWCLGIINVKSAQAGQTLWAVGTLFGNNSDFCKNSCTTLLVLCLFLWMPNLQVCMEQGAVNEEVKDWALWCPPFVMLDICNKLFCCLIAFLLYFHFQ